jgi:hypothetical protein
MTITYTDAKNSEWEVFKKNGGEITFEIDASDICSDISFENNPLIKPNLEKGFELRPTSMIETPELQALIQIYGSQWDYISCRIYLAGGKVVYKKQNNGKYAATCSTPTA